MISREVVITNPEIFISHRHLDKPFAGLFVDFLLLCGLKSTQIFCSSLPGNDVKACIPGEVRENLKCSRLNIVLLSSEYYSSPYCLNEAGIIWYLDTPRQIICMPEINENLMEGFLDSDNKIHRLDNKKDVLAIVDNIRELFPELSTSMQRTNENIDKLISNYYAKLKTRILPPPPAVSNKANKLESRILSSDFILEELAALRYLYDEKSDIFNQYSESFNLWLSTKKIRLGSINIAEYLLQSGIAGVYTRDEDGLRSVQIKAESYRELTKLSEQALRFIYDNLYSEVEKTNQLDMYIIAGFTEDEILMIKYAYDSGRVKFLCGWQESLEIDLIKAWEEINSITGLSRKYGSTLNKLYIRKIVVVSDVTSNGKTKEYRLSVDAQFWISDLSVRSINKMNDVATKYKVIAISDESDDGLPF